MFMQVFATDIDNISGDAVLTEDGLTAGESICHENFATPC
jgi:hypothetical protein